MFRGRGRVWSLIDAPVFRDHGRVFELGAPLFRGRGRIWSLVRRCFVTADARGALCASV